MFKLFITITVLAVAIFGSVIRPVKKKLAIEKAFEEIWRQRCNNVSGVELDIERNERLHQEYTACEVDAFNATEFQEEAVATLQISNVTNNFADLVLDSSSITTIFQKYCPKIYTFLNCKKKLFPIMNECYTAEENFGQTVVTDIYKRLSDFFCENGASRITELINGKVVECAVAKKIELSSCYEQYYLNMIPVANKDPTQFLFSFLPHADTTCKSLKTLGSCVVPTFQQCELSEIPAKLLTLLFSYLQTDTRCASVNSTEATLS